MSLRDTHYFSPHPDSDWIDKVEIDTVERWKTSGLSGDEWRFTIVAKYYRKGRLLFRSLHHRMRDALVVMPTIYMLGPAEVDMLGMVQKDEDTHLGAHDGKEFCAQPGCCNPPTVYYQLNELFSSRGEKLDESEKSLIYVRGFCEKHRRRGDCGREDSDRNYTEITQEAFYDGKEPPKPKKGTKFNLITDLRQKTASEKRDVIIVNAELGDYHDFQTQHATPKALLVEHLEDAGYPDLAEKARAGDYDDEPRTGS